MPADRFDAEAEAVMPAHPHFRGLVADALRAAHAAGRAEERATWQRELIGGDLFVLRGYGPETCAKVLKEAGREAGRAEALNEAAAIDCPGCRDGAPVVCHARTGEPTHHWPDTRWCVCASQEIRALLTESEPSNG